MRVKQNDNQKFDVLIIHIYVINKEKVKKSYRRKAANEGLVEKRGIER